MSTYADTLNSTKKEYPFDYWREYWQKEASRELNPDGVEETNGVQLIFDHLINCLISLGKEAPEKKKIKCFQKAIEATNHYADIIETPQAGELWELTNAITVACGLEPGAYGDGEGLASEWREW